MLALSQVDFNSQSLDTTLLDSATSVHVFNIKERFSNFRRASACQGLLDGSSVFSIEGWGQISLPLKVKGRIELLTLNHVAYISNFPLNLVSLGCLQKSGFDWFHRSGEISKTGQIIGYTRFRGNNYKIGDDKKNATAFATLAADSAISKSSWPYQKPHSAADSDTWHRRMSHIGPLGLHMLGKKCLGVRLQGKKMPQCTHCAVSKISQQVSRRPPANQSTRPFHRVYIDWLDLEDGWDSYQGDGAVVRRAIVAICEATAMAVTYFTQLVKESENPPPDTELYQLACEALQSGSESNTLRP